MPLQLVITNVGRAAIVAAANDGTNAVRIAAVGVSATATVASPNTAALPGELKRISTISGGVVADDTIHVIVRDESADVYATRSIALYLQDGTLFAAYGQADVIAEKSAQAMLLLAIDVQLQDIDAHTITFGDANFLNPPATTQQAGVVELADDAEATAMTDAARALTPRGLGQVFTAINVRSRLLSVDGAGSGLDADLLDGRQAVEFALLTGAKFTGGISATSFRTGAAGDGNAYLTIIPGSPTNTGYLEFRRNNEVREGYIGFLATGAAISYVSENGAGHSFTGGPVFVPSLISTGAIKQAGNQVWHAGNFNPANYAPLAAATFAGKVEATTLTSYGGSVAAFPATSPRSFAAATQVYAGEDTRNSTYRMTMGYWIDPGTGIWTGELYAMAAGGAAPLSIQRTGGDTTFGGRIVVSGATAIVSPSGTTAGLELAGSGFAGARRWRIQQGINGVTNDGFAIRDQSTDTTRLCIDGVSGTTNVTALASVGPIRLAGASPYIEFVDPDNATRWGYIQHTGATFGQKFYIANERGGGFEFTGGGLTVSSLNASGGIAAGTTLTRGGWPVWDQGNLAPWHVNNDGSGSGLDADLLDGRHASEFALLGAGLNVFAGNAIFNDVTASRGNGTGVIYLGDGTKYLYFDGNRYVMPGAGLAVGGGASFSGGVSRDGYILWDAGNDGAGSGLDADLLDGRDASSFANVSHTHGAADIAGAFASRLFSSNGYQVLPGGLILQWATGAQNAANGSEPAQTIYFPIAFPNAVLRAFASTKVVVASISTDIWYQVVGEPTNAGVTVIRQKSSDGHDDAATAPLIFAIGY